MKDIFETFGKVIVVIGCSIIQLIAVICNSFARLFGMLGEKLTDINSRIIEKLGHDSGKFIMK